jgi:hypothetical protein
MVLTEKDDYATGEHLSMVRINRTTYDMEPNMDYKFDEVTGKALMKMSWKDNIEVR